MPADILELQKISKSFGAHQVIKDIDLKIGEGQVVGLLGPNGSGKSTLLNMISGFMPADGGTVLLRGTDISRQTAPKIARHGLVRTFQLPSMPTRMTVRQVVQAGASRNGTVGSMFKGLRFDEEVDLLIEQFRLTAVADLPASSLSGGQKKLLSIATALRTKPQVLCLDEPTAGVHPELRGQMVQILKACSARGVTILVIEHDMVFIRDLCGRAVVLDRGALIADCPPNELENNPRVVEAYLGKAVEKGKVSA